MSGAERGHRWQTGPLRVPTASPGASGAAQGSQGGDGAGAADMAPAGQRCPPLPLPTSCSPSPPPPPPPGPGDHQVSSCHQERSTCCSPPPRLRDAAGFLYRAVKQLMVNIQKNKTEIIIIIVIIYGNQVASPRPETGSKATAVGSAPVTDTASPPRHQTVALLVPLRVIRAARSTTEMEKGLLTAGVQSTKSIVIQQFCMALTIGRFKSELAQF